MKRIAVVVIINLILCVNGRGQNLVPNPSFEIVPQCPAGPGALYGAPPWFQPATFQGNTSNSSSSDVFDTCTNVNTTGVPLNEFGHQVARTGHSYAGICLAEDTFNYREYIEVPLLSPLIANKGYCVQFYVSLADSSKEAISNFGAYFSVDSLLYNSVLQYPTINYVTPQFENPVTNMLNDKTNWVLVSGNFIASGGEKFMTLGNFHLPANTNSQNVSGGTITMAYYYIDDVSVTQCNVGVEELTNSPEITISPNPATTSISITSTNNIKEIKLINLLGEEVIITNYQLRISPSTPLRVTDAVSVDVSSVSKGIYFVEVTDAKDNVINRKVVVQ